MLLKKSELDEFKMKTCSVIITLLFSLERYKITSNQQKIKPLNKLAKQKLTHIVVVVVFVSSITCVNKIYEYDDGKLILGSIQYPALVIGSILSKSKLKELFMVSYLIHYLLNDAILLFFNLTVDILLVKIIKKDLSAKKVLLVKLNNGGDDEKQTEKYNNIIEAEKNTNKMIIYTFMMYLICRFPELLLYIYMILPDLDLNKSRFMRLVAPSAVEYLYVISYTTNIFFYFKFNKKFRSAFKNIILPKCFKKSPSKTEPTHIK